MGRPRLEPGEWGKIRVYSIESTRVNEDGSIDVKWCAETTYRSRDGGRSRPVRRHGVTEDEALFRLNEALNPKWIEGIRRPKSVGNDVVSVATIKNARLAERTHRRKVERHVVYRFFDSKDVLLYVGITRNLYNRTAGHRDQQPWWNEVIRIEIEDYGNVAAARAAELVAIRSESPKYNIADVIVD